MWLYANTPVTRPVARVNQADPAHPFTEIPMGPGFTISSRDPAELDSLAAEFARAAALQREALAATAGERVPA
jgi:hypothetical protein